MERQVAALIQHGQTVRVRVDATALRNNSLASLIITLATFGRTHRLLHIAITNSILDALQDMLEAENPPRAQPVVVAYTTTLFNAFSAIHRIDPPRRFMRDPERLQTPLLTPYTRPTVNAAITYADHVILTATPQRFNQPWLASHDIEVGTLSWLTRELATVAQRGHRTTLEMLLTVTREHMNQLGLGLAAYHEWLEETDLAHLIPFAR